MLSDTIILFSELDSFEISFVWTCKDEKYYDHTSDEFESLASELGVKFINSSNVMDYHQEVEADLVISMNFVNIIPFEFIEKFEYGVINAHAGDLPRYRGNACANWALLNGEASVTLCFHKMDDGLDSGPVIQKKRFAITDETYIGDVYDWMSEIVPKGFVSCAEKLISNSQLENQFGKPLRAFPRKPEDSRLDVDAPIEKTYRLIRASSRPFSGAYAFLNNNKFKVSVFTAQIHEVDYDFCAVNGQIMEVNTTDFSFVVCMGGSALKIIDYTVNNEDLKISFDFISSSMRNRLI